MYQWTRITDAAAFSPRDGGGALVFDDRMWLLGGWNRLDPDNFPHDCNSEVWASRDGADWELVVKQAPWEGRHTVGYAVHDGAMWIVGGDPIQGHYQPDVWRSDDGSTWHCVTDRVPWGERCLHYTVVFDNRIWIMGGQTLPPYVDGDEVFYSDVWCTSDGAAWERVTDSAPWGPRGMIGGSVVFQDRMWIVGGGTYDTPKIPSRTYYNDVWSSADGVNWEQHTETTPWSPRSYHDVAVFDDRIWVMEGADDDGNRNDVWHSADGVNWEEVPDTPWGVRHASSVYVYDDALWMVAGNDHHCVCRNDAWKLHRIS